MPFFPHWPQVVEQSLESGGVMRFLLSHTPLIEFLAMGKNTTLSVPLSLPLTPSFPYSLLFPLLLLLPLQVCFVEHVQKSSCTM